MCLALVSLAALLPDADAQERIVIAIFNAAGVQGEAETLAGILREAGYEVAKVGTSPKTVSRPLIGRKPAHKNEIRALQQHLAAKASVARLKEDAPYDVVIYLAQGSVAAKAGPQDTSPPRTHRPNPRTQATVLAALTPFNRTSIGNDYENDTFKAFGGTAIILRRLTRSWRAGGDLTLFQYPNSGTTQLGLHASAGTSNLRVQAGPAAARGQGETLYGFDIGAEAGFDLLDLGRLRLRAGAGYGLSLFSFEDETIFVHLATAQAGVSWGF